MVSCSKCGAQNADGARYCNNCAMPLPGAAPTAPQGATQQQVPGSQPMQYDPSLPPQLQPGQKATLLDYLSHYQGLQFHWAKRFVALVLDAIFVLVPVYVFLAIMVWSIGWIWFIPAGGIILFLYSAFFEYASGATIGKAIMGLKVVSIQGRLELPNTMIRNVTKIHPLLLLIEFIVTLVVETTDAHQRYTDKLVKTTVIEKRP